MNIQVYYTTKILKAKNTRAEKWLCPCVSAENGKFVYFTKIYINYLNMPKICEVNLTTSPRGLLFEEVCAVFVPLR